MTAMGCSRRSATLRDGKGASKPPTHALGPEPPFDPTDVCRRGGYSIVPQRRGKPVKTEIRCLANSDVVSFYSDRLISPNTSVPIFSLFYPSASGFGLGN